MYGRIQNYDRGINTETQSISARLVLSVGTQFLARERIEAGEGRN
jgi:hypothetical protein